MKIWFGYSSEHSANLVMIGRFKDLGMATKAKDIIDRLTEEVRAEERDGLRKIGENTDRYGEGMLKLLGELNIHSIGPAELDNFAYDITVKVENGEIVITTEEIDVSAFLKVLFDLGARIEVYSAHDYPETNHGRGK